MKELPQHAYSRHRKTAIVMGAVAGVLFLLGFIAVFTDAAGIAIPCAILAMIFGKFAFDNFERADEVLPDPEPPVYKIDLIDSFLKTGEGVAVMVALHYLSMKQAPHALLRIQVQLQKRLNSFIRPLEKLPADPAPEIEKLLNDSLAPLRTELGLEKISVEVIDVKSPGAGPVRSGGIVFGEVRR